MARIYRLDDGAKPVPHSERIVLRSLAELSDDWCVFHSVRWQSLRHGREGDGEADFVLLHRERGVLVLEVKGGDVRIEGGRWKSVDSGGRVHEIRNPFAQASDSKHALLRFFKELDPKPLGARIGHAVVFPSVNFNKGLGPYAQREITLYANDLLDPTASIDRVFDHWSLDQPMSVVDFQRIISLLAPTIEVRRTLKVDLGRSEAEIIRLTQEQQRVFSNLTGLRRLVVTGGPGTGKTLLAMAKARQLAEQGFRTRLVCYNELLGKVLSKSIKDEAGIQVSTFHSLCLGEARKAKLTIPDALDSSWWDTEAPLILASAVARREPSIDALIVDEAQDFAPSWFAALLSDLSDKSESPIYVFADDRQELKRREWRRGVPIEGVYKLSENCRSTLPIIMRIAALHHEPWPERGAEGVVPAIVPFQTGDDIVTMALQLCERLIEEEGLSPSDLTILCDDPALAARLRETYVSTAPVVNYGAAGIVCETIARFKGLESPAVLTILSDDGDDVRDRIDTAYVGLSRARSAAFVLAKVGHPIIEAFERAHHRR